MTTSSAPKRRKKLNWAPYLLILPSMIYLGLFFAWPMVQGLILAVREDGALLTLRSDAEVNSTVVGQLPRGRQVEILNRQGNTIPSEEVGQSNLLTEVWFQVRGEGTEGEVIRFNEFRIGLDHLSFTAPSEVALQSLAERLQASGVETQGVETYHTGNKYVAFRDPDNIQLEYWLPK